MQVASQSDGEFKEKQPPKSLVAIHRDNVDSSSSIPKKKAGSSGGSKKRGEVSGFTRAWHCYPAFLKHCSTVMF